MEPIIQELFTVKEVAAILRTNVEYVHKLRRAKLLPCLKLGCFKVRRKALEDFLAKYEGKDLSDPFDVKELDLNETEECS